MSDQETPAVTGSSKVTPLLPITVLTDKIGCKIDVGDILAYPARKGSSMWINFGIVTEFVEDITQIKIRLLTITRRYSVELGTYFTRRYVIISKWSEAIVVHPEHVNVDKCLDPSLVWCVHAYHQGLADALKGVHDNVT